MKTPFNTMPRLKKFGRQWLTVFSACLLFTQFTFAQIVAWNPAGLSSYGPSPWAPTSSNVNLTIGGLTRGAGVGTTGLAAGSAWGGVNWAGGATQDATFTITANSGYQVSLTTFNLFYRRSSTGPGSGTLQYAIDAAGYTTIAPLTFSSTSGSGAAHPAIDLSGISALQNVPTGSVIHLRILPTGGGSAGTWYVYSSGMSIAGNVNPLPSCTAPSGLSTSSLSSTAATINWGSISGITGYEYVLDMNPAAPSGTGTAIGTNSYSATGLLPSTTYYMHVRTNCGGTFSGWTTFSFTTNPPCTNPTGLTVNSFNASSVDISWASAVGILGFEYVLDMSAADPTGAGTATTATTYSGTSLLPSTTYYFHLRKNCGGGDFSNWTSVTFTTNPPCIDPTGLTVNSFNASTVNIGWNNETGITGFEYVLDMSSSNPAGAGTATTTNTFSNTGLSAATTYYFHLRKNCGSGDFSNWTSVTFTTNPPCVDATGLTVNSFNSSSVDISWDSETGITGFEYVLDMSTTDPTGAGTPTTTNTFSNTGLSAATTYYFHLRKNCGSGDFSNWTVVSFTTNPPCVDPTGLAVNSFNSSSVDISWDSETGITGFEYVLDMSAADPTGAGTATVLNTLSDNTLSASTTYYFHLRKNCGSGDFSNWTSVVFTTNPPCVDPTGLAVNSFNSSSVDISWDSETGITGFEYVLDMNTTDPTGAGIATTTNTFNDNTLSSSTTYYFHLRKNCGSGDFSNWTSVVFTTNSPCVDATGLTVNSFNSSSVDISWNSETGITGFEYVLDMNAADPSGAGTAITTNTFNDNTLSPSTTYYFHLRKDCGSGDFSNWTSVVFTTNSPCVDATGLTVNSFNSSSVDIGWDSETGITGFEYVLDMSATDPTGAGAATTTNTFNDNTLSPSTTYYFHLRKNCGSGDFSNWVTVSFITNTACANPTGLTVNSVGTGTVDLSWDSETGITGFEYVLDMNAADPTGAGTATVLNALSDNTLSASTTYYFHLRKDCGSGDFSGWATVSFTTLDNCADPTSLAPSTIGTTNVVIGWDNETGITGFESVLDMNPTAPSGSGTPTTTNSFTDNTLLPSTTYYFHLRKDCGSGNFSAWITISFTTQSIPTGITITQNNNGVNIYPNPTNGLLKFTLTDGRTDGTLMITDMTGKVIINTNVNSTETSIDLSHFAPQVYSLIYMNGQQRSVFKIIKQ